MRDAADDVERLIRHDAAFHRAVIAATGNRTLTTLLERISSRTLRARGWRGLVDANAAGRTLAEHEAIYTALAASDPAMAQAAALLHVASSELWLRPRLTGGERRGVGQLPEPPTGPVGDANGIPVGRA